MHTASNIVENLLPHHNPYSHHPYSYMGGGGYYTTAATATAHASTLHDDDDLEQEGHEGYAGAEAV